MSRTAYVPVRRHLFGKAAGRLESVSALAAGAGHTSRDINLVGVEVIDDGRDRGVALVDVEALVAVCAHSLREVAVVAQRVLQALDRDIRRLALQRGLPALKAAE